MQSEHTDAPALEVYFPAAHAAHAEVDPDAPNHLPATHATHADAPVAG